MNWGFENEAAVKGPYAQRANRQRLQMLVNSTGYNLVLGTDESPSQANGFSDSTGLEFRTARIWSVFPYDAVSIMIRSMEMFHIVVTPTCGLHFHFSGVTLTDDQFNRISEALLKTHYWHTRKKWITDRSGETKYAPLRKICDGHYEARVFNASNKFHGIYQPWLFLKKLIVNETGAR